MKSLFFNVSKKHYKSLELFKQDSDYIRKVDISSGVLFFNLSLSNHDKRIIPIDNRDKLVAIVAIDKGVATIDDKHFLKEGSIHLYTSSIQHFTITLKASPKTSIFVLFVADFILKRYLSQDNNNPIDYLFQKMKNDTQLELINKRALDSLSLHFIDKIITINDKSKMQSFLGEHHVMEFLAHQLLLLDIIDTKVDKDAIDIAKRAKSYLLKTFHTPPSIKELSHICATNQTKLKSIFKKVYGFTIYTYIQKLRLQEASILLKEQELTIGEIAKKVGYKHQGNFTKRFFEIYGIYPKDLLKNKKVL